MQKHASPLKPQISESPRQIGRSKTKTEFAPLPEELSVRFDVRPKLRQKNRTWCGLRFFALLLFLTALPVGQLLAVQEMNNFRQSIQVDSINGTSIDLASSDNLAVVFFMGTECPLVKLYIPRIEELKRTFGDGVDWVAIASNHQDSVEELKKFANEYELTIPIHKDQSNVIADRFGAKRTPEVFLLNAPGEVLYQGAIDDQYSPGVARALAKNTI